MLTVYFFVPMVGRSCVNELLMTVIVCSHILQSSC